MMRNDKMSIASVEDMKNNTPFELKTERPPSTQLSIKEIPDVEVDGS
jgi:hypothetical protein